MKREIKFRGKSIHEDVWLYGWLMQATDWSKAMIQEFEGKRDGGYDLCAEVIPDTVGQFTGLLDACGKEIYEGDIIESKFGGGKPARHFVGYNTSEAAFTSELIGEFHNSGSIRQSWIDQYGKKVIGNIYDNKELLEEVK